MSLQCRSKCGSWKIPWLALAIALVLAGWACRGLPQIGDSSGAALPEKLPEAAELVRRSAGQQKRLESVRFTFRRKDTLQPGDWTTTIAETGVFEQPDMGYVVASDGDQTSRVYLPDAKTVYEYSKEKKEWTLASITALAERGIDLDGVRGLRVLEMLTDTVYIQDKTAQSAGCVAVKFQIDIRKYVKAKAPIRYMGRVDTGFSSGGGSIWIRKKDGYIQRIHYNVTLNLGGWDELSEIEWNFSGQNEPVDFNKIQQGLPATWWQESQSLAMAAP